MSVELFPQVRVCIDHIEQSTSRLLIENAGNDNSQRIVVDVLYIPLPEKGTEVCILLREPNRMGQTWHTTLYRGEVDHAEAVDENCIRVYTGQFYKLDVTN